LKPRQPCPWRCINMLKGGGESSRTAISIPEIPSPTPHYKKTLISQATRGRSRQIPWFQNLWKQVSLFRSCTLCVQGLAQRQEQAQPACHLRMP
jgi:hypothetical protein